LFLRVIKQIENFILPPHCVVCKKLLCDENGFCGECFKKLSVISSPYCKICGRPFVGEVLGEALCGECLISLPSYDAMRSAFVYDEASSRLVSGFKYADQLHLLKPLARQLARISTDFLDDVEVIVPVPLHYWRLVQRRYNQSALLAKELAKITSRSYAPELLTRLRFTTPQVGLKRSLRKVNVKGAFGVKVAQQKLVAGKRVLLVDDVVTTGATIEECVKALKNAGASKVYVATIARTFTL